MFVRHPRSVFMLRTHFIKHSFEFPPHFLVIHTLPDHNTSYLVTPFFSDLTELTAKATPSTFAQLMEDHTSETMKNYSGSTVLASLRVNNAFVGLALLSVRGTYPTTLTYRTGSNQLIIVALNVNNGVVSATFTNPTSFEVVVDLLRIYGNVTV